MSKYETKLCTVFDITDIPLSGKVNFYNVTIALGSWDEEDDAEDESIFYYMDGEPLEMGMILTDGFVVTRIDGEDE